MADGYEPEEKDYMAPVLLEDGSWSWVDTRTPERQARFKKALDHAMTWARKIGMFTDPRWDDKEK